MSHTLSEQEISLLSAFHDGETTAAEAIDAQRLLERSPEARAWLRDAGSVRSMSVEAANRVPIPRASAKLTGSAIATAAQKGMGISGGGFFAVARSPLGLAGAAAALVVGALVSFQLLQNDPASSIADRGTDLRSEQVNVTESSFPFDIENIGGSASMVPPITRRDLIGFALDGLLPINSDKTQCMGMDEEESRQTSAILEIEERMATLGKSQVRALDSLAELLRSSIVRVEGNTCAVRSDLPDLRMAVINQLDEAELSGGAQKCLDVARGKAEENRNRISTSLEDEMRAIESRLLASGEKPYVLIESNEIVAEPTGDRNRISILRLIGERNRIISINPNGLRISEPNQSLAVAQPAPARKKSSGAESVRKEESRATQVMKEPVGQTIFGWRWVADRPFMQSVTINLFSGSGMTVIVSDDVDTTFESPTLFIREESVYSVSAQIDSMTSRLNFYISRVANDRSESAEDRAWKIVRMRREYREQLRRVLESLNAPVSPEPLPNPEDSTKEEQDVREEAASREESEEEKPLESTCLPWEDCTGLG